MGTQQSLECCTDGCPYKPVGHLASYAVGRAQGTYMPTPGQLPQAPLGWHHQGHSPWTQLSIGGSAREGLRWPGDPDYVPAVAIVGT